MTARDINDLIEASSLGTPEAKALRDLTPAEAAHKFVEWVEEIAAEENADAAVAVPLVDRTRRAVVSVGDEILCRLLNLPEGMVAIGVNADWGTMSVQVMVAGPQLSPVAECCEAPRLLTEVIEHPDGGPPTLSVLIPRRDPVVSDVTTDPDTLTPEQLRVAELTDDGDAR